MKSEGTKNIIAAIILGVCIIIGMGMYVYSTRYEIINKEYQIIADKWKGTTKKMKFLK